MKNNSKIIFGFSIIILVFTFSAFTNKKHSLNSTKQGKYLVLFNYLVQRAPGQFTQINTSNPFQEPNYLACMETSSHECVYIVTLIGKLGIPSLASLGQTSYTTSQIDYYLGNSWLQIDGDSVGALYWD